MNKFIIKDWAGNVLNYKGRFDQSCFAVAMEFDSFDDAWGWIYDKLDGLSDEEMDAELGEYDVIQRGN